MMRLLILMFCLFLFTGCTVTKEGIIAGNLMKKFAGINLEKCKADKCPEKIITIGTVSAVRNIDDYKTMYGTYVYAAEKFVGEDEVNLSEQGFVESIGGWTVLQVFKIPLVGAEYVPVFIPSNVLADIDYASTAETILYQGTGDLVVAESNADGVLLVDRVLCKKKNSYIPCKRQYYRAVFDAYTGEQLGRNYKVKRNGRSIDVENYKLLK